ncbi:MAG: hemerythrin domain-containing protein [Terracidiphilus sp.]|jgi:hemerythrin
MELIPGNSELSVGVKILDCDHREMTEAIYEIQAAVTADRDPRRTESLLRKLAQFSLTHFALEEGMMAATRFPGLAPHRLNHQRMIERMKTFVSRQEGNGLTLDRNSLHLLAEIHAAHVEQDDLRYGLWLNAVGKR